MNPQLSNSMSAFIKLWANSREFPENQVVLGAALSGASLNASVLAQRCGVDYVIRMRTVTGDDSKRQWEHELYSLKLAGIARLAPAIEFFSMSPQAVVSRFSGAPQRSPLSRKQIQQIAEKLASLHRLEVDDKKLDSQSYRSLVEHYYLLATKSKPAKLELAAVFEDAMKLSSLFDKPSEYCFTHHDLTRDNLLWKNDRVQFIDWEYACIGHPDFDIATLARSLELSATDCQLLLDHYSSFGSYESRVENLNEKVRFVGLLEILWRAAVIL